MPARYRHSCLHTSASTRSRWPPMWRPATSNGHNCLDPCRTLCAHAQQQHRSINSRRARRQHQLQHRWSH
eukprot:7255235-Lingulodinium_polyedra.AAC.1